MGASSRGKLSELENAPSCVLTEQNEPRACSGSKTTRVYRPLLYPTTLYEIFSL